MRFHFRLDLFDKREDLNQSEFIVLCGTVIGTINSVIDSKLVVLFSICSTCSPELFVFPLRILLQVPVLKDVTITTLGRMRILKVCSFNYLIMTTSSNSIHVLSAFCHFPILFFQYV